MTGPTYILAEPFCGSAAFSMHMMGAKRSIMPYQGSKWRHRKALEGIAGELGFSGKPEILWLADTGPWSDTWGALLRSKEGRNDVLESLRRIRMDPKARFDCLNGSEAPFLRTDFAAEFLFLQRLAFSGKHVKIVDGCWRSPGFNKTSAYGKPATDRFGEIKPMLPSLIRAIEGLPECRDLTFLSAEHAIKELFHNEWGIHRPTLVYLDPPYAGTTGYGSGCTRTQVIALANRCLRQGAAVMASEAEPLTELKGWRTKQIAGPRTDGSPFKGKQAEWVTYCKPKWVLG